MIYDEIVDICEVGEMDSIDIEVSGNHYFYANDILTHNSSTDVGLEDVSESFGLPATADFMFALMTDENLEQQNKIMVKQLKNRFNEIVTNKKFLLKINRGKMKLYDDDGNDVGNGLVDTNASGKTVHGSGYGPDEFSRPKKSFEKNVGEWKI